MWTPVEVIQDDGETDMLIVASQYEHKSSRAVSVPP